MKGQRMRTPVLREQVSQPKVLTKAVTNLLGELDLKNAVLASWVGIDPGTVTKLRQGSYSFRPDSNEGERALLVLRIYRSLSILLSGNQEHINLWLMTANKDIGAPPVDAMKKITGLVHVAEYLDAMRGKV